jgi:hypothetical protein
MADAKVSIGVKSRVSYTGQISPRFLRLLTKYGASLNLTRKVGGLVDEQSLPEWRQLAVGEDHSNIPEGISNPAVAPSELLVTRLDDSDGEVRLAAVQALAERQEPGVVAALVTRLDDSDGEVRLAAVQALAKQQEPEVVPELGARDDHEARREPNEGTLEGQWEALVEDHNPNTPELTSNRTVAPYHRDQYEAVRELDEGIL